MLAVTMARGPTIILNSGAQFDFLDPDRSEFSIEDIAHGLSNICRYNGQCRNFYSVAEHSIHVSYVVSEFLLAALLHDATEAFIGDVTRPLKQLLPDYRRLEQNIQRAIFRRFNVPIAQAQSIKQADLRVLAAEQAQIMPKGTDEWARDAGIRPASIVVQHMPPAQAKQMFLQRFEELQ